MQVEASSVLQGSMELDKARCHVDQIRHRVILTDKHAHGGQGVGDSIGYFARHQVGVLLIRDWGPYPRITERLYLCRVRRSGCDMAAEQDIVVTVRVERGIEVHQVNGLR